MADVRAPAAAAGNILGPARSPRPPMPSHHCSPAVLFLLFATACNTPAFVACKSAELTVPAASLRRLQCESHNGFIKVIGEAGRTEVAARVEMSVRGCTQEEADANLARLEVGCDVAAESLRLYGRHPVELFVNRSPSFAFTLTVPEQLTATLTSHNGAVTVKGLCGDVKIETHNGGIDVDAVCDHIDMTSHNGDIGVRVTGRDQLDGSIVTHNGDVDVHFGDAVSTTVAASTHNGRIRNDAAMRDVRSERRSFAGTVGSGAGRLLVETHNGDIGLH